MQPVTFVVYLFLLVIPFAQAQSCSTTTQRSCSTQLGIWPPFWPVFTYTRFSTAPTAFVTTTPIIIKTATVPGVPLTATVSSTKVITSTTTAAPGTNTITVTSTTFATTSATTTSTTTGVLTTTVTSISTSVKSITVSAPSSFLDAYGSTGDSNYAGSKRGVSSRFAHDKRGRLSDLLASLMNNKYGIRGPVPNQKSYFIRDFTNPVAVQCIVTVQKICATAQPTTSTVTSTAAPTTTTSTIVSTITSTTTQIPASVTTTVYSGTVTSTITQVTTIVTGATSTSTLTSTSTTTTTKSVYAACATGNLLGPRIQNNNPKEAGFSISKTAFYDASAKTYSSSAASAVDCCGTCAGDATCQFYAFVPSTGQCFTVGGNPGWCPSSQQDSFPAYFVTNDPAKISDPRVVGNGPCGTIIDAGADTTS